MFIDVKTTLPTYAYINLPGQYFNWDSNSKVEIYIGKSLFIEATYDVILMNFEDSCVKYTRENTYDLCNTEALTNFMEKHVGCTIPFAESHLTICRKNETKKVSKRDKYKHVWLCPQKAPDMYYVWSRPYCIGK